MTNIIRIPDELQQAIIDFCYEDNLSNWLYGYESSKIKPSGNAVWNNGRKYIYCHETKFHEQIKSVEQEYLNAIGLPGNVIIPVSEDEKHPHYPHFIACIFKDNNKSSGVQTHVDTRKNGWHQMRINYLLQKPESGGEPIINRTLINVKENQSWSIWASENKHSALPVTEDKMRITVSFGFYVNPEYVNDVKQRVRNLVDIPDNV